MDTCPPPPPHTTHTCSNLFAWKVAPSYHMRTSNLLDLICDPTYPPPSPIPELFKIVHLRNSPSPVPIGKRAVGLRLKGLLVSSLKLVALIRCWVYHVPFLSFFYISHPPSHSEYPGSACLHSQNSGAVIKMKQ